MTTAAYQYLSDDGTIYQIVLPSEFASPLNYAPASGAEPYVPSYMSPRFANYQSISGGLWVSVFITLPFNRVTLPDQILVQGVTYLLKGSVGEARGLQTSPNILIIAGPQGAPAPSVVPTASWGALPSPWALVGTGGYACRRSDGQIMITAGPTSGAGSKYAVAQQNKTGDVTLSCMLTMGTKFGNALAPDASQAQPLSGNSTVFIQISDNNLSPSNGIAIGLQGTDGLYFNRWNAGGYLHSGWNRVYVPPVFIRCRRVASTYYADYSFDNSTWNNIHQEVLPYSGILTCGLGVYINDNQAPNLFMAQIFDVPTFS